MLRMTTTTLSPAGNYRARIYAEYASRFQDATAVFDVRAAEHWGRAYRWYLRGWLPNSPAARILDVACGGGRLLHFFKTRGYSQVTGVDISPQQIALARQVTSDVHQEDVLRFLEEHPRSFDLISGLDIIEHFHKDEALRFLDACHVALHVGGRLVLQTPNAQSPCCAYYRYGDFTHEICFSPDSLLRLLKLCGFSRSEAREQGPVPWGYSASSTVRSALWLGIRGGLWLYNLAETGARRMNVFTRVFLASAVK
jgi:SAM-dependent methyltransferase